MNKITYFTAVFALALVFGCDRHLNLTPVSYITGSSFFKTEDDAEGAINGLYVQMRNDAALNYFIWGEARSEMMESALAGTLGYDRYYKNSLSVTHAGPQWNNLYSLINQCNLALKYIPQIAFSNENEKNDLLAQAYTMRAYAYYTLVRLFGGVPKRTEPFESYDPAKVQLPRTPEEDIFTFIKDDISKAEGLFHDNTIPSGRCKWSYPALMAFKGDVYLWTAKVRNGGDEDVTTALNALEEVRKADVGLLDEYDRIFRYDNKGNREILMSIRFLINESGEQSFAHAMYAVNNADYPAYVPKEVKDRIGTPKAGNGNIWRITAAVRNQFSADDSRKDATFINVQSADGRSYFTNYGMKFRGAIELGARYFLDDWIVYRYADVLLMIAEAKNALGQDPSPEINEVRKRAYGDSYDDHIFVNGTKSVNDDAILKERLFELSLEGKRWWDLIRFDKVYTLVPSLKNTKDHIPLLWPLSLDTMTRETLVGQTPGYATN